MRRRTAPRQTPTPPQQQRMPQPSIKSSQAFSPQQGQYQQQIDPRRQQTKVNDYGIENASLPKMSLPQAITLITLRLGSIESKLMNGEIGPSSNLNGSENLEQFNERINLLEEKLNSSSTNNYKQQIDQLVESIIQLKNLSNSLMKDNKELKKQLTDIKNSCLEIRQLAMNNETKIFQMLNSAIDTEFDEENEENVENEETEENVENYDCKSLVQSIQETNLNSPLCSENGENGENDDLSTFII